jgi:hypothetical protein
MIPAEISFDLDMNENMPFVEGTFRLSGGQWQVFIFGPDSSVSTPLITTGKWASGVTGIFVKWPESLRLNKKSVVEVMSQHFVVTDWNEVHGPDSIKIR